MSATPTHPDEPHGGGVAGRLNWLRAGVLGANDGIVSVAAIAVGVAGATNQLGPIVVAATAALVGGAISMALGEYVSVSSQRDSERALIAKETRELSEKPEEELAELTELYRRRGLSPETAARVAEELTSRDALAAHLEIELRIDREDLVSPGRAAAASALAFTLGGLLPFAAAFLPSPARIAGIVVIVLVALALTGATGARLGGAPWVRATLRVVLGGALALAATYLIGLALGTAGAV